MDTKNDGFESVLSPFKYGYCRKSMLDFPGGSKPGLRILISAIPKVAIVFLMGIARIIQLSTFSHIMSKS